MFESVSGLSDELAHVVARLDASLLTGSDAAEGVRAFARLERLAAAGRTLLAKRVDETGAWRLGGQRTAAEWLAHETGSSIGAAIGVLRTSSNLESQPKVEEALRSGALSLDKAKVVSRAVRTAPDAEEELVATAVRAPIATVRAECAKATARAEDPVARGERCRKERRAWFGAEEDGMVPLRGLYPVATAAKLRARLEKKTDQIFRERYRSGDEREARDRYMADALAELICAEATGSGKAGVRANVLIRVDLSALRRGTVAEGEVCDAPGVGELTPADVEALMAENDCIIDALLTRGRDVLKIVRVDRYVPVDLQKALSFADPTCCVSDCPRAYGLERDHRDDFARSRRTAFDNLDRACDHHHQLKTRFGWKFVRLPDGRCWMERPAGP